MYAMWATESGKSFPLPDFGSSYDIASYNKSAGTYVIAENYTSFDEQSLSEMPIFIRATTNIVSE
jgi:hypothetical protein